MFAGHDTTAYQLSWIIIELARNPDCVSKLRIELDSIFPPKSSGSVSESVSNGGVTDKDKKGVTGAGRAVFTPQHLSQLPYLSMVIKEGMRLWPVTAVGTSRISRQDIQYKDKVIPQGSILSISFFAMFRPRWVRESLSSYNIYFFSWGSYYFYDKNKDNIVNKNMWRKASKATNCFY